MEFSSLGHFAAHLLKLQVGVALEAHQGLEKAATAIEKTAKEEVGTYQRAIGPYGAWPELAESTKKQRVEQGYSENDPGLRSGAMRDSISHHTSMNEAVVGSDDQHLVWFELGTDKQEPRAVLGPAVEHNHHVIRKIMGRAFVRGLLGHGPIPPSLEYDHEI